MFPKKETRYFLKGNGDVSNQGKRLLLTGVPEVRLDDLTSQHFACGEEAC